MYEEETIIYKGKPFHYYCKLVFTKYLITGRRINIDTGIFNVNTEEIRLHRVNDISVSASLIQRMFGRGSVTIYSNDITCPTVTIRDIPNYKEVARVLSDWVEYAKATYRSNEIVTSVNQSQHDYVPGY